MLQLLRDRQEEEISYLLKKGSISFDLAEMYALGGVKKEPVDKEPN